MNDCCAGQSWGDLPRDGIDLRSQPSIREPPERLVRRDSGDRKHGFFEYVPAKG